MTPIAHARLSRAARIAAVAVSTFVALISFCGTVCAQPDSPAAGGAPSKRDIAGNLLAEEVFKASGGETMWRDPSWDLRFDFVVVSNGTEQSRYSHIWYRALDRYIVSGKNREGRLWRVSFSSLAKHDGDCTIDGNDAPDSVRQRLLDAGYGRFINDTYWLLMPLKLLDSGVQRRREADTVIDGTTYQVLSLSFGQVGLTPGDRYRILIDPATKLVRRWSYHLQSGREGEFAWENYRSFGALQLALSRRSADGAFEIRFENVQVDRPSDPSRP